MKSIVSILLMFFFGSMAFGETIVAGYNHVPPDTMKSANGAEGPAIRYFDRIAKRMGVEVKYQFMPLARLMDSLNRNKIDCIIRIGANPLIKVRPQIPFTATVPGILFRKDNVPDSIKTSTDLTKYKIGTKIGMPLTKSMGTIAKKIEWIGGTNALPSAIQVMMKRRIDGVYSPAIGELIYMADQLGLLDKVEPRRLPDPSWNVYVAFSPKAHEKHYKSYAKAMKAESKVELYAAVYEKFLKERLTNLSASALKTLSRDSPK